jgi:signal transduction histidine kinase
MLREEAGQSYRLVSFAQDISEQKKVELVLRKTLDRTREQFTLSRKMSLARKPEAVLKALMSASELHSAQRAALLFFENPEAGPIHGLELRASWQSSQALPAWSSELNLYEEPALRELFQPNRTVVFLSAQADPRLSPVVRDLLLEGNIHSLAVFPLVASGVWLGCLFMFFEQEHDFNKTELRHLNVLVDQATITLYNLQLLEVEEELRREAERTTEIKTRFLAMISHELRTPLTSIKGFTDTLLAEDVAWEPHEQRDFIHTIQRETNRLEELIDHLLDLTRLEAGMLPITPAPHSLDHILEDMLPQFNALTRGQKLLLRLPDELPPVLVDAKRIAQVLVNLVRNASAYAPGGTQITISARVLGEFVQVDVTDQGPGIPPAERKRVFEAFRRGVREENGPGQGAGLGLAICKGLVEAHAGRIWVKKSPTSGATLSFTIPLAPVQFPAVLSEEGN